MSISSRVSIFDRYLKGGIQWAHKRKPFYILMFPHIARRLAIHRAQHRIGYGQRFSTNCDNNGFSLKERALFIVASPFIFGVGIYGLTDGLDIWFKTMAATAEFAQNVVTGLPTRIKTGKWPKCHDWGDQNGCGRGCD